MHGLALLLLFASGPLVTVPPGPEDGCPGTSRVAEALRRHVPASFAADESPEAAKALRLRLTPTSVGGTRLSLVDPAGVVQLRRELPPVTTEGDDCRALAETVALIVQRYVQELEPPEAPAAGSAGAAARWDLALAAAVRQGGAEAGTFDLGVGVARTWGRWVAVGVAAGVGQTWDEAYAGGTARGRRFPLAAAVWGRVPAGPGEIQAGPIGGFDVLRVSAAARDGAARSLWRMGPFTGAALGYRLGLSKRVFLRASIDGILALSTYELTARDDAVFATARVQVRVTVGGGFSLP